ncbi:hypothetical protein GCM10020255_072360 [Rhodococcus baikonurensis]
MRPPLAIAISGSLTKLTAGKVTSVPSVSSARPAALREAETLDVVPGEGALGECRADLEAVGADGGAQSRDEIDGDDRKDQQPAEGDGPPEDREADREQKECARHVSELRNADDVPKWFRRVDD